MRALPIENAPCLKLLRSRASGAIIDALRRVVQAGSDLGDIATEETLDEAVRDRDQDSLGAAMAQALSAGVERESAGLAEARDTLWGLLLHSSSRVGGETGGAVA